MKPNSQASTIGRSDVHAQLVTLAEDLSTSCSKSRCQHSSRFLVGVGRQPKLYSQSPSLSLLLLGQAFVFIGSPDVYTDVTTARGRPMRASGHKSGSLVTRAFQRSFSYAFTANDTVMQVDTEFFKLILKKDL